VAVGRAYINQELVAPGKYVLVEVTDTGTGMTKETQQRLFEPFFTTKDPGKGTGLGLSTIYGIVKQSKGHIVVSSVVGEGTTFHVYLPCVVGEISPPAPPAVVTPVTTGSETVLLVEDEVSVRRFTKRVLEAAGYRVLEATNGIDAQKVFAEHGAEVHLLVTDVIMPGCGGPELLRRLQAQIPTLKVLYMSGYTEQTTAHEAGLDRGLPFAQKPFTGPALLGKVREALNR
jgi:CheY-like chemotaxis protein